LAAGERLPVVSGGRWRAAEKTADFARELGEAFFGFVHAALGKRAA
jgi:hypothetical protein